MLEIIKMIITYGIYPVLMGALIFVMLFVLRKLGATLEKVNQLPVKEHTKEEEEENRQINNIIDLQLEDLLNDIYANRASLFLYHNGGFSPNGRSFQKMSVMNERVDFNTIPFITSCQDLPRRTYPKLMEELSNKGEYFFDDINQLKEKDPASYYWLAARNVKTVYIKEVNDNIKDVALGFIMVEYVYENCHEIEKTKLQISKVAQRIGGVLQVEKKK